MSMDSFNLFVTPHRSTLANLEVCEHLNHLGIPTALGAPVFELVGNNYSFDIFLTFRDPTKVVHGNFDDM